jgi:glycosyltransferase involved in cell wall biosynthesis/peptidoglycan/xylan/chitin deacetylase (PgdA/CDA1 family)
MKVIISHDVDHLKPSDNLKTLIIPKAVIRAGIEMALGKISPKEFRLRLLNIVKNKWQNIDSLMAFDRKNGIKATYFIGVNNGLGLNYSLQDAEYWTRKILRRGFDVGVHGIDFDSLDAVKKEFETFKRISGLDEFGIRMHYLRTDEATFEYMAQAGYLFDASKYVSDLKHSMIGTMHEFPLHIMDGYEIETNRQWQTVDKETALRNTIKKVEELRDKGVEYLSVLIHPRYFDESYLTWKEWYEGLIDYFKEQGYEFVNFKEAIAALEQKQLPEPQTGIEQSRVCHISTVHQRYDVRIFHKECKSLAKEYEVSYIVADGKGDELHEGIHIFDVGQRQDSRLKRVRIDSKKALEKAIALDCDVYHIHDPELITIAAKLQKKGKKVIYDVHEDLPRQIYGKPYLTNLIKPFISTGIEFFENRYARKFDFIVTATPYIYRRFIKINSQSIDINNFPIVGENKDVSGSFSDKENYISYVGGIFETRGVYELIDSLKYTNVRLLLAGEFETPEFKKKCESSEGWSKVDYFGFVSREEVAKLLNKSKIGMVSLYPLRNYLNSLPIKMFEYMLAGIPVIASDFPYWQSIIDEHKCGLTVNPKDPQAIAGKINYLLEHPAEADVMGKNGRKAVLEKYNWCNEKEKLLEVYRKLLPPND